MNIVLVQNDRTVDGLYDHWRDIEGERYHFPNQYKNKIVEGTRFIYYRGVRRATGRSGMPEYFGCGRIGRVWLDPETDINLPKRNWYWYCEIVDYIPFNNPVYFKINNIYFEDIAENLWGVTGRTLSDDVYNRILAVAHVNFDYDVTLTGPTPLELIDISEVRANFISEGESLIVPPIAPNRSYIGNGSSDNSPRRSRYSKIIGDRAEEVVFYELEKMILKDLCWVAREKRKPGWDIEYYIEDELISIEVKGTSAKRFTNVEITANEWDAAKNVCSNYWLYLVADCLSKQPKIQRIQNPAKLLEENRVKLEAVLWKLTVTA